MLRFVIGEMTKNISRCRKHGALQRRARDY